MSAQEGIDQPPQLPDTLTVVGLLAVVAWGVVLLVGVICLVSFLLSQFIAKPEAAPAHPVKPITITI